MSAKKQATDLTPSWRPHRLTMSKTIPKECVALLKEASEMFEKQVACLVSMEKRCQLKR